MDNLSEIFVEVGTKIFSKISKNLRNLNMKNNCPETMIFLFLFTRFQKQMTAKSKINLGVKPLGKHKYIKDSSK